MPLSINEKKEMLNKTIEIAKAAAGSGGQGCVSASYLSDIIKDTYEKMVEVGDAIK